MNLEDLSIDLGLFHDKPWFVPYLSADDLVNRLWIPVKENPKQHLLVCDLDGTIAPSPAKKALWYYAYISGWKNWSFILWTLQSSYNYLLSGKSAESEIWASFLRDFLENDDKVQRFLKRKFTEEFVKKSLYNGFEEFLGYFAECHKVIVSRINGMIGEPYRQALGFDKLRTQQNDKAKAIDDILAEYKREGHEIKTATVIGDSEEDKEMSDYLENRLGPKNVIGINIVKSYKHRNHKIHINQCTDYAAADYLMRILEDTQKVLKGELPKPSYKPLVTGKQYVIG